MSTYNFTFPRSKTVQESVEQNAFLSSLALESFVCSSDEIWHESEDEDHPVHFPLILLSLPAPLYAKNFRCCCCTEEKFFNLGMSTLEDSERADKPCS